MTHTIIILLLFGALLLALFAGWGGLLSLGLRWAKADSVSIRRIALTSAIVIAANCVISFMGYFADSLGNVAGLAMLLALFLATIVVPLIAIALVCAVRFGKATKAWLVTLLLPVVTLAFLYIVWKPFVSEAFVIPTNAMAPTLLGLHQEDACPECGSIAYFSRPEPILPEREQPPTNMICERFHVHPAPSTSKPIDVGDRIVVAKYLKPRRWDLIVFRFPADATQTYVKRLVGLPGEEVVVKDGNVWADGRRLEPPAELAGIEYLNAFPEEEFGPHIKVAGTEDNPARLGDDEYFVLGDFSAQSYDSRLWMEGAAGHPPYSVPHENLIGVVTTIYWPRERWRSFR